MNDCEFFILTGAALACEGHFWFGFLQFAICNIACGLMSLDGLYCVCCIVADCGFVSQTILFLFLCLILAVSWQRLAVVRDPSVNCELAFFVVSWHSGVLTECCLYLCMAI